MTEGKKQTEPMSIKKAYDVVLRLADLGLKAMSKSSSVAAIKDMQEAVRIVGEAGNRQVEQPTPAHSVLVAMLDEGQKHMDHTRLADIAFFERNGAKCAGHMNKAYARLRRVKELGQFATTDLAKQWIREQVKKGTLK